MHAMVRNQEKLSEDADVSASSLCSVPLRTDPGISCSSLKVVDQQRQDHSFYNTLTEK